MENPKQLAGWWTGGTPAWLWPHFIPFLHIYILYIYIYYRIFHNWGQNSSNFHFHLSIYHHLSICSSRFCLWFSWIFHECCLHFSWRRLRLGPLLEQRGSETLQFWPRDGRDSVGCAADIHYIKIIDIHIYFIMCMYNIYIYIIHVQYCTITWIMYISSIV